MPRSTSPKIRTRPSGGKSRPAAQLSRVDLPQPDGPTTATKVPSAMSSEIRSATVWNAPEGARKRIVTRSKDAAGAGERLSPSTPDRERTLRGSPVPAPMRIVDELVGVGGGE